MSIAPTTAEVERAKSQTKAAQLLSLDGTLAISEDVRCLPLESLILVLTRLIDRTTDVDTGTTNGTEGD